MSTSTGRYHRGSVREDLLAAGVQALTTHPARELSVRDLAKTIGVSHAAPYRHFADQRAFLSALAAMCLRELVDHERQVGQADPVAVGVCYVRWAAAHPNAFALIFDPTINDGPEPTGELVEAIADHQAVLSAVTEAVGASPETIDAVRGLLWGSVHGLATLAIAGLVSVEQAEKSIRLLIARCAE